MKEVRVAMIGFGGIAKSHKKGYEILAAEGANVRLVAICDIDPSRFTAGTVTNLGAEKAANLDGINTYTNVDEMLEKEDFSMVDICIPTYLHCEYAIKMMKAGKHVLSEKPMALNSADCEKMLAAAKEYNRVLMIGQCLRFEPAYLYLKKCVDEGTFGKLKNMRMHRMSSHPMWGFEQWYTKTEKSGGCIMDLHIHDVDMARFLLGEPDSVSCLSYDGMTRWLDVNSRLFYPEQGVNVFIDSTFDQSDRIRFRCGCNARFERANVIITGDNVEVFPDGADPFTPELEKADRMAEEIRKTAKLSVDPAETNEANPPESARNTIRLIELLRESAAQNGAVLQFEA